MVKKAKTKARKRTTIEVDPIIHKALQYIAKRRKRKVKFVSDTLLRASIPWEEMLFAPKKGNRDNGK
jgi:predicted transcriptional regulator